MHLVCNRSFNFFILQNGNFILTELPIFLYPQPLKTSILLSVSKSLTALDTSCKWNKQSLPFYD